MKDDDERKYVRHKHQNICEKSSTNRRGMSAYLNNMIEGLTISRGICLLVPVFWKTIPLTKDESLKFPPGITASTKEQTHCVRDGSLRIVELSTEVFARENQLSIPLILT